MSKTLYKEGVQKIRWCKKEVQKRGTKRGCKEALSNSLFLVSVGEPLNLVGLRAGASRKGS